MSPTLNTPGAACSNRPRPWPVAPRPFDGEAFGGWLGRLAAKYSMTVEQLWTHADLGPMPTLTQWKWLLFPPVPIETLERFSQLTHVSVDRLRAMQTPIGWIYERRRLRILLSLFDPGSHRCMFAILETRVAGSDLFNVRATSRQARNDLLLESLLPWQF